MSEIDFLKLKKHDNPETNTEKFDIENYLNGNWDKINENAKKVNTDILNIQAEQETQNTNIEENNSKIIELQNEKAKLEKELKEAQEDFYQASIRGQASGEYIHVEDSSNCRSIIGISGNSEQETRSGKNLLLNDTDKGTVNGITFTKDSKGIIKANGTATDAIVVYLGSKFTTIAAGTYKLSDGRNDESKDTFFTYVDCYNTDGSAYATGNLISTSDGSVKTYTEPKLIKGRIVVRKGVTLNNIVFKPQLELIKTASDSATEYEQYGASPSPDYPSEIESVGSNINILPANLFLSTALNGINYTNKDGIITVNGTATENSFYTKTITLKAGTYTLNGAPKGSAQDKYCLQAQGLGAGDFGSGQTFTIDAEKQVTLRIMVWKGITVNNIIFKPKLNKGTEEGEYSKFGQGCVKVTKCNKNAFIETAQSFKDTNDNTYVEYIEKTNEYHTTKASWARYILSNLKIGKNYTLSFDVKSTVNNALLKNFLRIDKVSDGAILKTFDNSVLISTEYKRYGLTFVATEVSLNVTLRNADSLNAYIRNILLVEGIDTNYQQHHELSFIMPIQQPMRSIGDIRDTFIKKNNKWYERHYINRLILNGTESWDIIGTNTTGKYRFQTKVSPNEIVNNQDGNTYMQGFCNRLIMGTPYTTYLCQTGITTLSGYLIIYNEKATDTIDNFKAWLSSNNLTVDYLLKTPIDIECTEEQSKILDKLNNARTYKNVTNITTDSIAILDLDYAKDLETLLNNTQALAVNNASEGV